MLFLLTDRDQRLGAPDDCRDHSKGLETIMSKRLIWRKTVNGVMLALTGVFTLLTVSALFLILGYLLYYGGRSLDWNSSRSCRCLAGENWAAEWPTPSSAARKSWESPP